MSERLYRKKGTTPMRPYVPGEDMTGVSVSEEDQPPREGGFIAHDPNNQADRWYINPEYHLANYEPAD